MDRAPLAASAGRAVAWLRTVQVDPFTGDAMDFRRFVTEVETWHRIWVFERPGPRKDEARREVESRLRRALDRDRLGAVLDSPGGSEAFTEFALLASRCRIHGLDPGPIGDALRSREARLRREVQRVPPSLAALYAVYLPAAGIDPGVDAAALRSRGLLASRPDETAMDLAAAYYLTHEIFAYTDYATGARLDLSPAEGDWLLRVGPFFTVLYSVLNNIDIVGELLCCLQVAGMRDTYAYREGVRVLLERQNPDGSFGAPDPKSLGRPAIPADYLHPTLNAVAVLLRELASADPGAGESP
ncbi:MAG: hypothetical protein ACE15D_01700 [Candidatus Eisenbacteria bacterium]